MSYQLILHSLSVLAPTPKELMAQAGIMGLKVELDPIGGEVDGDCPDWTRLSMRALGAEGPGFTIQVAEDLKAALDVQRRHQEEGHEIPDIIFESQKVHVLEFSGEMGEESEESEEQGDVSEEQAQDAAAQHAAFALTAWALAAMTDAVVFDPQEELFADADSFMGLLDGSLDVDGQGAPADLEEVTGEGGES